MDEYMGRRSIYTDFETNYDELCWWGIYDYLVCVSYSYSLFRFDFDDGTNQNGHFCMKIRHIKRFHIFPIKEKEMIY